MSIDTKHIFVPTQPLPEDFATLRAKKATMGLLCENCLRKNESLQNLLAVIDLQEDQCRILREKGNHHVLFHDWVTNIPFKYWNEFLKKIPEKEILQWLKTPIPSKTWIDAEEKNLKELKDLAIVSLKEIVAHCSGDEGGI